MKNSQQKFTNGRKHRAGPRATASPDVLADAAMLPAEGRLSGRIGAEIRMVRRARRMTLEALSQRTGFSIGFLSQVERGRSALSISSANAIAKALGISLAWFFQGEADAGDGRARHVVRKLGRKTMAYETGLADELLSPHLYGRFAMFLTRFAPGASSGGAVTERQGEQAGYVVQGALLLTVGDREYHLTAGDAFHFDSSAPHTYANRAEIETVVVWVVSPPNC